MNICISTHQFPPEIGGTELYSERLASELDDRGHEVTVYTTAIDEQRDESYKVREFWNPVPEQFGYFAWPGILCPTICSEIRSFDVIHAVNASMFSAVVGAFAKRLSSSLRAVLTTTYHPPRVQTHKTLKRTYDRLILQRVLEQYDRLLVSSDYELKQLQQAFDLDDCRIERLDIPPITSCEPTINSGDSTTVEDPFTILYVGRLDAHKGVLELLHAIDELVQRDESIQCGVVGERERWYEWPDEVVNVVDRLDNTVEFMGSIPQEDLAEVYSTSDVLVLPSQYETSGLVVVEALSYGTPVVMTPVGIGPERIKDGYNGIIYDPDDPDALVNALEQIKHGDRDRYEQNARDSVADLSWTELIDHLEEIYSQ